MSDDLETWFLSQSWTIVQKELEMRSVTGALLAMILLSAAGLSLAAEGAEYDAKKQSYYQAVEQYQSGMHLTAEQISLVREFGYGSPSNPVIDNFGGPDILGYSWLDSEEPDGPTYQWMDITATGTDVTDQMNDDNYVGPFQIGFNFPFYDQSYSQFWIHSNGLISFTDQYISLGNVEIPTTQYGPMIAWFWDDLDPDTPDFNGDAGGYTYYESIVMGDRSALVIEYLDYERYPQGEAVPQMTAELIIYDDGEIKMQYMSLDPAFIVNSSTIGIQNADGTVGLMALYNGSIAGYPYDELAIEFSRMDPNANVSGTITDAGSGIPIIGAEVIIGSGSGVSAAGGAYTVEGVYAGSVNVTITTAGYYTYYDTVVIVEGENVIDFEIEALPPPQDSDYFTDFENDQGFLFTEGTATNTWEYGQPTVDSSSAYSGEMAWDLALNTTYSGNMDDWLLTSTSWALSDPSSYIAYWHWFDFDQWGDGYNLQVSTNGGDTWELIYPDQGYTDDDGVFANDNQACFNNNGTRHQTWEYVSYSLADYVGQQVWFGWRAVSDGWTNYAGVCIDDLEIYVGQEPGPDAVLDLIPISTTIPPSGGTVVYDASFVSEFPMTIPGIDFWTWARTPSGNDVGPLTSLTFTHTPFMNVYVTGMTLEVPAWAEGGDYVFNGA
ncbi:MAG TPA: carboxypeptidase regulatory-like domain-containing protein, partial [Bacteroidetes bacterium]|nr:carboxypeptidase regulatory-like domain-containing protein [Bacteroidota bacterium]HEX04625.1 carboxypeptidase regulatory-like domain-containing protein [Bacteroidota bacterium]